MIVDVRVKCWQFAKIVFGRNVLFFCEINFKEQKITNYEEKYTTRNCLLVTRVVAVRQSVSLCSITIVVVIHSLFINCFRFNYSLLNLAYRHI